MTIKELYEELNYPSKKVLQRVAKKRGISTEGIDAIIKQQPVGQLFGQAPAQKGAIATTGEFGKFQADLMSFKSMDKKANGGHSDALSVTNVYDRKTHVLPLKSKEQSVVWAAFEKILEKFGGKPARLDVDGGNEFAGTFAEKAEAKGIQIHVRKERDINFLGIGDNAIGAIKKSLGRDLAAKNSEVWVDKIEKAEKAHNNTPNNAALYGSAPNEVKDDEALQFKIRQQNGFKMVRNAKQLKQRQDRLNDHGYFRAQLPKQTFVRGHKPKYSSIVYKADEIKNNQVISGGKTFEISKVLPVPSGSARVDVPAAIVRGSAQTEAFRREKMERFVRPLKTFLKKDKRLLQDIGKHMKTLPGFSEALVAARMTQPGSLKSFIKLFTDFSVEEKGKGQPLVSTRT